MLSKVLGRLSVVPLVPPSSVRTDPRLHLWNESTISVLVRPVSNVSLDGADGPVGL